METKETKKKQKIITIFNQFDLREVARAKVKWSNYYPNTLDLPT